MALTIGELNERLKEIYPEESLEVLTYSTMKEATEIKCLICGTVYSFARAENVLGKSAGKKRTWGVCHKCHDTVEWKATKERFLGWLKDNPEWELADDLTKIHNSQLHIKCKCKSCGRVQENKTLYDYLAGKKCYCKNKGTKKPLDVLLEQLGTEYQLLGEYHNTDEKAWFKRKRCGHEFYSRPADLLRCPEYCPLCHASAGERRLHRILDDHSVKYQSQYKLYIDGQKMFVDIYIPSQQCFIEYNGAQHYRPVEHFGGIEKFEKQHQRDTILDKYCQENGIKIIWISYLDFDNIESILEKEGVL